MLYADKKVLITGHTGFKGSWLCRALLLAGADVTGYALEPPTSPSLFDILKLGEDMRSIIGDVRDREAMRRVFDEARPEIVIHMAAQPIVRESYKDPVRTYETNVMGTVNVLECVRGSDSVRSFVNVTTDKVYKNREWVWGYRENEELDGYDPYSNSKSCSELVTAAYRRSFLGERGVAVSTMRAGNVIGGGDFAPDRIIPDCVRAALEGCEIAVRNPRAVRPYQHVLEPVSAYLEVAAAQCGDISLAGSYNVGPGADDCVTTEKLVSLFCEKWNAATDNKLKWVDRSDDGPHEANYLRLDCSKIESVFGIRPLWNIEHAVEEVVGWTKIWADGGSVAAYMDRNIRNFFEKKEGWHLTNIDTARDNLTEQNRTEQNVLRAKRKNLFSGRPLTDIQKANSDLNVAEMEAGRTVLASYPRRLFLELTNACNLSCVMCGRNAASFRPTRFDMDNFRSLEPLMDTVEEVTLMGWGEPTIHPDFAEMLKSIDSHSARKYFCTNGMNLGRLKDAIFDYNVDVFAVSLDGATDATNSRIRRGSKIDRITDGLREIVRTKRERGLAYPWINFVFCAMNSNLDELPALVRLAADIGMEEVKAVYLTVFDEALLPESLWGQAERVRNVFGEAARVAGELGIQIKLPHVIGEDEAGGAPHKDCFVSWRDFFVGSDGYVRPCMSTPVKFFAYDRERDFMDMWNSPEYQNYRAIVNDAARMDEPCARCYQSSHCNWNRKESFIQVGEQFSPEWEKKNADDSPSTPGLTAPY